MTMELITAIMWCIDHEETEENGEEDMEDSAEVQRENVNENIPSPEFSKWTDSDVSISAMIKEKLIYLRLNE